MTIWHWAQLALAGFALFEIARSSRRVLLEAPSDAALLEQAIGTARDSQPALALAIARACEPAWAAQAWHVVLDARGHADTAARMLEELRADLVSASTDRMRQLAALGRVASPLAFLAIIMELAQAFGGRHGLLALQRGLVERIALERALLSFALGLATTTTCLAAAAVLRARLDQHAAELAHIERNAASARTALPAVPRGHM